MEIHKKSESSINHGMVKTYIAQALKHINRFLCKEIQVV